MSRVPRFQQRERLLTANLADDDPVWSESHSRAYEPSHIRGVGGMQLESVARGALQLQRVLDDDEALGLVAQSDHLVNECIDARGFAGAGSACDRDVPALGDSVSQCDGLGARYDVVFHIVVEGVEDRRAFSDHKAWRRCDGWKQALETAAGEREFALDDRILRIRDRIERGCNCIDQVFPLALAPSMRSLRHPGGVRLNPDPTIRIENDLDHVGIGKSLEHYWPELAPEF